MVAAAASRPYSALAGMQDYDVGGFRLNLRGGVNEATAAIDLVSISADGRVIR